MRVQDASIGSFGKKRGRVHAFRGARTLCGRPVEPDGIVNPWIPYETDRKQACGNCVDVLTAIDRDVKVRY